MSRFLKFKQVVLALAIAGIAILAVAVGPGSTSGEEPSWPEPSDYATRRVLGLQSWDSTCGIYEQGNPKPEMKLKTSQKIWDYVKSTKPTSREEWVKKLDFYITNEYFSDLSRAGSTYEEKFRYGDFFVNTDLFRSESRAMGSSGKRLDKFERILNKLGKHNFDGTKVTTTIRVPAGYECFTNEDSDWLRWSGTQDKFPFVPAFEPDGVTAVDWSGGIPTPKEVDKRYREIYEETKETYDLKPYKKRINELVNATIYRGAGMEFYRKYFRALSNSDKKEDDKSSRGYGSVIGYYEPAEEPGWGFNLIEKQYDVDHLKTTGKFKLVNYLGPKYAWIHFYGWPTIDYPKLQQVAYDEIKKNDPGGKSCVISGSLVDDQAYILKSEDHPNGPYEFWDSYNRALDDNGRPGQAGSARIESNVPVLCERPMYFNYSDRLPGGHCTFGSLEPSKNWYFAEGCTWEGFEEYLCIQNPTTKLAKVRVEYMTESGVITRGHDVAGNSRYTVTVHDKGQAGPDQNVSAKVTSDNPIICERPMYFNNKGKYKGGHIDAGANSPQKEWYFAEGCTRPGFETWLCVQNPGDNNAKVNVTYMLEDGGMKTVQVGVDGHRRKTVNVNDAEEGVGPGRDVSMVVQSDQAIVCERPVYFEYTGRGNLAHGCDGGHNTLGANSPGKNWYFAEGCTRHEAGRSKFETWLCLQNPSKEATVAKITCMTKKGTVIEQGQHLPPHSRVTVFVEDVVDIVAGSTVGAQQDVSIQVQAGHPIVCERPLYFNYNRKLRALRRNGKGDWRRDGQGRLSNSFAVEKDLEAKRAAAKACSYTDEEIKELVGTTPEDEKRVNYHWEFYDEWVSGGHNVMGSMRNGATKWYFAEGAVGSMWPGLEGKDCTGNAFESYICIMNPNDQEAEVELFIQTAEGQEIKGRGGATNNAEKPVYKIPSKSRETINLNTELSFGKSCDAIGVHLFGRPETWEYAYDSLKRLIVGTNGEPGEFSGQYSSYAGKELVVSSCGWPHGDPLPNEEGEIVPKEKEDRTYLNHLMSIGEIKDLMSHDASEPPDEYGRSDPGNFCNKVWVYKDVDEQVAKDNYFGYFSYHATDPVPIAVGDTTLWAEIKKLLDALTNEEETLPANRFTVKTVEEYLDEYGIK